MILLPVGPILIPFFNSDEDEEKERKPENWEEAETAQKEHNRELWTVIIVLFISITVIIVWKLFE